MISHPPAHLCHPCQNTWAAWSTANMTVTQLDGAGEGRRLQIIADQQADIVARCEASNHERTRTAATPEPAEEQPPAPTSLLGAQAKRLLDDFEALLPPDSRTREEKVSAAIEQMRADHQYLKRTGHHRPHQPASDEAVA